MAPVGRTRIGLLLVPILLVTACSSTITPTVPSTAPVVPVVTSPPELTPTRPSPHPATAIVPSFLGMTKLASSQLATSTGFAINVAGWKPSLATPATVISQDPKAGRKAAWGTPISITLAKADSPMGGGGT